MEEQAEDHFNCKAFSMSTLIPYYLLAILLFATCRKDPSPENNSEKGELIFQSGFENGSGVIPRGVDADNTGTDRSLPDRNHWVRDLDSHESIGNFNLQYQGGDSTMRFAKIREDPEKLINLHE